MPIFTLDNISIKDPPSFGLDAVLKAPDSITKGLELLQKTVHGSSMADASQRSNQVLDLFRKNYHNGMGPGDNLAAIRADGRFNEDDIANAKLDDRIKENAEEERANLRLKLEGDRIEVDRGNLDVNRGRLGLERVKYGAERADKARIDANNNLFNQFTRLFQIDPEAANQFYKDNKKLFNSAEYADANSRVLALVAQSGRSTQTTPVPPIPEGYTLTPEEHNPARTRISNELANSGPAVPFIQSRISGKALPLSEVKKGLLGTAEKDTQKYAELVDEFGKIENKLKAANIPDDVIAYVLDGAVRTRTFFDGIKFNEEALIAQADGILKSAQQNGIKIRNLLKQEQILGNDPSFYTTQIAARDQKHRVIDRALAEGDITSKERANAAKAVADSNLYTSTRPKQMILDATRNIRKAETDVYKATQAENNGLKALAIMRQEASTIKNPEKRAEELANIDLMVQVLKEDVLKANANAENAKKALYALDPNP